MKPSCHRGRYAGSDRHSRLPRSCGASTCARTASRPLIIEIIDIHNHGSLSFANSTYAIRSVCMANILLRHRFEFFRNVKRAGNPNIPAPFARDAGAIIKLTRYPYHQTKNKSRTKLNAIDKDRIQSPCSVHMRSSKLSRITAPSGNVACRILINEYSRSFKPDQPARFPGPAPYPMITFGTGSVIDLISQRSLF